MTDAAALTRIDLAHRAQQVLNAARIAALIRGYWLLVDPAEVSGPGGAEWLRRSTSAVLDGRRISILLAQAYTEIIHQLQVPRAPRLELPPVPEVPLVKVQRSLAFTGLGYVPVELKKVPDVIDVPAGADGTEVDRAERALASREERQRDIMEQAITNASRSAVKLVVDGGRDTTDAVVRSKVALGYFRVTQSKNPCGFCLALASRGPVYEDDSFELSDPRFTGLGEHKVHDGCACTLRPVFTREESEWSEQARQADQLWTDFGKVKDGRSAMENFRRQARILGLADANRW